MATGSPPFKGQTSAALFDAILHKAPTAPVRLNAELPPALEQILNRSLEKDRKLRYQTASDLRADLQRVKRNLTSASVSAALPAPALETPATAHSARKLAVAVVGAAILAVLLTAYFFYRRTHALTERDVLVLADFVNTTGDAVFDGTLRQALAVELEQSPFLNIFPDERVRETLRFMGRSPDERVTASVAREICQREGVKAMLVGSIASLGSRYSLTLQAVNCQTGDSLASEQAEAESKEQVLRSLG
jgi:hypothetical protein